MNQDLFLAILAMDAYNRGYGEGIANLGGVGSQLGDAKIIRQSDFKPDTPGVNAGFYAVAYEWTQEGQPTKTVISYRGTDSYELSNPANDVLNGWLAGIGKKTSQVGLAATH
jgi:hypothetical protein